jgi:ribosomal protein S18 acetylase RimI-like enzyme
MSDHRHQSVDTNPVVRILGSGEGAVLRNVARDVFDNPLDAHWSAEFLDDSRHHLAVALDDVVVVGMASGVHYLHPDKPPELWINELGVAPSHRGRGIGKALLDALLAHGRTLGCDEAWLLTDMANAPARRLCAGAGGEEKEPPVYVAFRLGREQ